MKRFAVYLTGVLLSIGMMGASAEEIHLKNGSLIKGDIIEQVPGKTMTVSTRDGNIIVINVDDVERITKSSSTVNSGVSTPLPGGIGFGIDAGVDIATKGGNGSAAADILFEKRFSKNFSAGIGAGINYGFNEGAKPMIPMFADFKGLMPLSNSKVVPFVDIKAGYLLNTAGDVTYGEGKYKETTKMPDFILLSFMPGVRLPLSSRTDLDLGVGYQHHFDTEGSGGNGAFGFRVGLTFHKSTDPNFQNREKKKKPVVPTRNRGLEFGLEGTGVSLVGLNLLLGYKCSPNLSLALGVGATPRGMDIELPETKAEYYSGENGTGELLTTRTEDGESDIWHQPIIFFVRGEYRLNTKKFSPIARVDIGYQKGEMDRIPYYSLSYGYYDYSNNYSSMFVIPAVGISWRVTNNSYLECALGYSIGGALPKIDIIHNYESNIHSDYYKSFKVMQDGKNLSHFNLAITWKRTFRLFSK